jgi:hypothetical protein
MDDLHQFAVPFLWLWKLMEVEDYHHGLATGQDLELAMARAAEVLEAKCAL